MAATSVSISRFVEGLMSFGNDYITRDRIAEFCEENPVDLDSLKPHISFRDDRYTRNLVFRDKIFEVMVICWKPGQKTPVHTHNGQLGWMKVAQGAIDVKNYKHVSCNAADNQNVSGIDCLAGATEIRLDPIDELALQEGSPVALVDKVRTIHSMTASSDTSENTVTLHLYSLPFESCVSFDLQKGTCFRRQLFWDSEHGKPVER